jgi:hypothetical protein
MKNLILFFVAIIVVAFSMSGCSKGTAGPAGPKGPAGPDSIIYSSWITLSLTLNVDASNDSTYSQTLTVPAITSAVLDQGAIVSYIGIPGGGGNGDTLVVNSTDLFTYTGGGYLTQDLLPGVIDLYFNFDISQDGALYRYVIIPGTILSTSVFNQYTKAQIKKLDYSTVTKLLNTAKAQSSTTN